MQQPYEKKKGKRQHHIDPGQERSTLGQEIR